MNIYRVSGATGLHQSAARVVNDDSSTFDSFLADSVLMSDEAKKANELINVTEFYSQEAYDLLKRRGLSDQEITRFAEIIQKSESYDDKHEYIKGLSDVDKKLVKKANSYGSDLTDVVVDGFSDEGVQNMLVNQDRRNFVDYNNDGIVEHGKSNSFVFPPPNSPESVQNAYDELTSDMSFEDRLLFEAQFMMQAFVVNIRVDADGRFVERYSPGDPRYKNIFSGNDDQTWRKILDGLYGYYDFLDSLGESKPKARKLVEKFDSLIFAG